MYENLDTLQMAQAMARHASARQAVLARNVANADTPGYRGMDVPSFAETYETTPPTMRATRPGHLQPSGADRAVEVTGAGSEPAPNGNSVSLETEMMKASEVRHESGIALSIWSNSLDILRAGLGRIR
ncbi:flagellar basal-body rod protein FlgB [Tranquillimonas rosea]|uniref:Flagellar basal-body rod protein FlgB n=1 Tax=Tranquillimonas rosea TaxID=641238 RepID=A0A1H9X531_9RHOB|nr:FlgB family protein [Tranquillimonas rosea]SES41189.1 flagellar basal-body rod protein FlgB [Tranquillimonas rosea]